MMIYVYQSPMVLHVSRREMLNFNMIVLSRLLKQLQSSYVKLKIGVQR